MNTAPITTPMYTAVCSLDEKFWWKLGPAPSDTSSPDYHDWHTDWRGPTHLLAEPGGHGYEFQFWLHKDTMVNGDGPPLKSGEFIKIRSVMYDKWVQKPDDGPSIAMNQRNEIDYSVDSESGYG
jgi:hypothetical protein